MKITPAILAASAGLALVLLIDLSIPAGMETGFSRLLAALPKNSDLLSFAATATALSLLFAKTSENPPRELRGIRALIAGFFAFAMLFGWAFANYNSASILFEGLLQTLKSLLYFLAWFIVANRIVSLILISQDITPQREREREREILARGSLVG